MLTQAERGTWHHFVAHVRVPASATSNDGVIQLWKDGALIADYQTFDMYGGDGENYMDEAYLLGWANSGFAETTVFYIDNVVIADTPIGRWCRGRRRTCKCSSACRAGDRGRRPHLV